MKLLTTVVKYVSWYLFLISSFHTLSFILSFKNILLLLPIIYAKSHKRHKEKHLVKAKSWSYTSSWHAQDYFKCWCIWKVLAVMVWSQVSSIQATSFQKVLFLVSGFIGLGLELLEKSDNNFSCDWMGDTHIQQLGLTTDLPNIKERATDFKYL